MKKITKVVCSTALIVGMLGTAQAFSVSAMVRPIITGDVDWILKLISMMLHFFKTDLPAMRNCHQDNFMQEMSILTV